MKWTRLVRELNAGSHIPKIFIFFHSVAMNRTPESEAAAMNLRYKGLVHFIELHLYATSM